ncbi:ATP-dependent metallopeptidase Hfl [Meredithblackwellia eburnea MCA 4105]
MLKLNYSLSLLSLLLDSSGIMRATSQASPFTPTPPPDATNAGGRGTTFKDVHGVEEAKGELYEVVEFLKDPKKFEKLGGRLPRGVLLTGPPGTGKTLLARAVAGEAGVNFFTASGSEFDEMYVGVGARRIRELFKAARKAAPAIIFIDELDAIGGKRSPRDQHYVKQTLNQLLVELDGFSPGEGVILLGATNFPESLDKALIRPGRFDCHIVVPLPDVRGRMKILQHHMKGIGYDKAGVDISTIARGTIGFSGADLQALVNQAAVKASADNASSVRAYHFEWAKERIMMGAARKSAYISDKDKLATAYHEGGHALVALYTAGAYPLQSVTVVPRGNALGYTLMLPEMDKSSHTLSEYRAKLDVAMGGRVAEELIYGKENVTDGASSDIQNATSVASNMVRRFGFSDKIGPVSHPDSETPASPETQALIESEVRGLIEAAQGRAMALLKSKKTELERLARALVEHETLDLVEVQKICKGEKIAKPLET